MKMRFFTCCITVTFFILSQNISNIDEQNKNSNSSNYERVKSSSDNCPDKNPDIVMTIITDKNKYKRGNPVELTILLENKSEDKYYFHKCVFNEIYCYSKILYMENETEDKKIRHSGCGHCYCYFEYGLIEIPPKYIMGRRMKIDPLLLPIDEPFGKEKLKIWVTYEYTDIGDSKEKSRNAEKRYKIFKKCIRSNVVEIEVE
jgi:hypothetical protein